MCLGTAGSSDRQLDYQLAGTVAPVYSGNQSDCCNGACVCVFVLSHVWLFVTLWTVAHQAPFLQKNAGVGCHFLLQSIFPTQGSNPHNRYTIWSTCCLSDTGLGAVHDLVHCIFIIAGDKTRKSQCWRKRGLILNPMFFVVVVLLSFYSVFSTLSTALVTHDSAS